MADPGEIGKGSHPSQNPPPLEGGDAFVWNWYQENSTGFVRDYGLMPFLLKELGLNESGMRMMILKLTRIHRVMLRMDEKQARKMQAELN